MKAKQQAKQQSKDKATEHNKPITSKRKQNKAIQTGKTFEQAARYCDSFQKPCGACEPKRRAGSKNFFQAVSFRQLHRKEVMPWPKN